MNTKRPAEPAIRPWSIIILVVSLLGLYFFVPQLGEFKDSLPVMARTNWVWVLAGLALTLLAVYVGAFIQYAAGNWIGSWAHFNLIQFAGSFVNHFLPFNVGTAAYVTDYYRSLGKKQGEAVLLAILPTVFGIFSTMLLVSVIAPSTIGQLWANLASYGSNAWMVYAGVGLAAAVTAAAVFYWARFLQFLLQAKAGLATIKDWKIIIILTIGSIALAVIPAAAFYVSARAINVPLPLLEAFTLYVISWLADNVIPTPGGLGTTEAILVVGMVTLGISLPQAVATTLVFRFITFWAPILPESFTLRILHRRRQALRNENI